jgi:predicted alpha/beta superfamily hydrolase
MSYTKKYLILTFLCLAMMAQAYSQKREIQPNAKPFVLGVVDEIQSVELNEQRILNIYLPEGYKENKSASYPVIYLLDGAADEDFIHIAGLVQYNSFEWVNRCPQSIVVGIATVDRRRDFTFEIKVQEEKTKYPTTGQSARFIAFIEKELQPYIKSKYRTNSSATLMGQSLGGLLATEILLMKPSLFDKYIIVSPSLWWDNGSLLERNMQALTTTLTNKTEVYIGVGKEGLTPSKNPRVMEVDANLLAEKLIKAGNKSLTIHFDYLPDENHATIYHQAVLNAFKIFAKQASLKN